MFASLKSIRNLMIAPMVVLAVACVGLVPVSSANAQDGTVELEIVKASLIVGAGGGSGKLNYQGKTYRLGVGGVSVGASVGISKTQLVGEVYNLSSAADIAGTYTAVSGSAVLAGGESIAELKNSKGVVLRVSGRSMGLEISIDLSGLQISLK